jgi:dTDP-glucose 4,6-dehydratase
MNLLVTGGAGFIGSHLIRYVINFPEVQRLVNLDCLTYAGNVENLGEVLHHSKYVFEKVDLRDAPNVTRVVREHQITHVLHLAAESHVDRSIVGPGDFVQTNVVGTYHLLEACRSAWEPSFAGRRFQQVSTDEVYGSLGAVGKFTEASPMAPNSPYSASKAAADLLVRSYRETYQFPSVITRSTNNYGPFQFPEKLIPVTIDCIRRRTPIPIYGDGQQRRDWLHVRDHAAALWLTLTRGRMGATYNIGGGTDVCNLQVVEMICDWCDTLAPELGGNSRRLITFVTDRPGHDWRYALDTSQIQKELNWQPQLAFSEGIRETVAWYLNNQSWVDRVRNS